MNWERERDALLARTLEFVQTVTGKKEDAGRPAVQLDTARPELDFASLDAIRDALNLVASPQETLKSPQQDARPKSLQRSTAASEMQSEIRSRIESFRAHQERFNRERAEYFNATLARLRATIDEAAPPRIGKIAPQDY